MPAGQGELEVVLLRRVRGSELLLDNFETPLVALADYCRQVLDSEYRLQELVREADVEWARVQGERPYFENEGGPAHPEDLYTLKSVREALAELMVQLAPGAP